MRMGVQRGKDVRYTGLSWCIAYEAYEMDVNSKNHAYIGVVGYN